MAALEDVFVKEMPQEMGYDSMGMSFQERQTQKGVPATVIFGLSLLFVFLILAAQYKSWVITVQRPALHAYCGFRCVRSPSEFRAKLEQSLKT